MADSAMKNNMLDVSQKNSRWNEIALKGSTCKEKGDVSIGEIKLRRLNKRRRVLSNNEWNKRALRMR